MNFTDSLTVNGRIIRKRGFNSPERFYLIRVIYNTLNEGSDYMKLKDFIMVINDTATVGLIHVNHEFFTIADNKHFIPKEYLNFKVVKVAPIDSEGFNVYLDK